MSAYPSEAPFLEVSAFIRRLPELGIRVLVESLPGNLEDGQPAQDLLCETLMHGVSVVTVDKSPLVHAFDRLQAAAASGGAKIAFSGTTGVWPTADARGQTVLEIEGTLNGTTNHILSEMCETGADFETALREARDRGIAEPDPRLDIDGWDAAAKILILSRALMHMRAALSDISRTGISPASQALVTKARSSGRVVRLVAHARLASGQAQLTVRPEILGPESPFYSISGTAKAAIFRTAEAGQLFVTARSGLDAISGIIQGDLRSVTGTEA